MTALTTAEHERSTQAVQLGQGHTQAALQLMTQQGPAMRLKLVQLTQLLLRLLDGFVMPADLVGSGAELREALIRGQSSGSVTMASSASADPSRRVDINDKMHVAIQHLVLEQHNRSYAGEGTHSMLFLKAPRLAHVPSSLSQHVL